MRMVKTTQCSPASVCGQRASSLANRRKRLTQPTLRATTQRRCSKTTPLVASFRLMTCKCIPSSRRLCRFLAWICLIDVGQCEGAAPSRVRAIAATMRAAQRRDRQAGSGVTPEADALFCATPFLPIQSPSAATLDAKSTRDGTSR